MSLQDQNLECPLCMEPFEMDDFNFFPCTCGYQICRFCWHRIRTDENGLCPACRKQYPEDPADFKPLSVEEWQKIKSEKRQKDQQKKQKMSESRKHLANVRVVQKNLVFVVGLPARLADVEILKKYDYFGKFGKMHKVVVNQTTAYAGSQLSKLQGPSASAYVTYCRAEDALRAIKSVNNIQVDGRTLKASLGTTKYCSHFLKNQQCLKTDCMYLHELGDEAASFTKEDMQQGKHQEYEKKLQDQILSCNNHRQKTASPTPTQDTNSWPCTVQSSKESRTNRSKDSSQNQKSDGKNNRSKNKHTSEGQKSKRGKNKSSDSTRQHNAGGGGQQHKQQHNNNNSSNNPRGETENSQGANSHHKRAQKHGKEHNHLPSGGSASDKPAKSRSENSCENHELSPGGSSSQPPAATTYVHICEDVLPQKAPKSASIHISRSESPPSPISSSSSSLFTPFGSLSSNFMSSSSPSPPPVANSSGLSFGSMSSGGEDQAPVAVDSFEAAPSFAPANELLDQHHHQLQLQQQGADEKSEYAQRQMFDCSNSFFSHGGYSLPLQQQQQLQEEVGSYKMPLRGEQLEEKWMEDSPKHIQEDDLDFDPWNESSKGLADLIAKEAVVNNQSYSEMPTPPGFFQPIKAPVPNQQRIAVPPPGFCSRQAPQSNSLNHLSGMYGPSNSDFLHCKVMPTRQNNLQDQQDYYFQDHRQTLQDIPSQYKQQYSMQNGHDNLIDNLRYKKSMEEQFRNIIPDVFYHLNSSRNLPKNQNGSTWNSQQQQQQRDISWLSNEAAMLNSEGPRSNAHLWKALQQLQIEENTSHYNGHSAYPNPFATRGQWTNSAQCPPPGFVAPSRSPVNSPFQHMQINQKI